MPEMPCHRNLGGVDLLRSRCLYRAISGINGNTAASIAMTASRFSRHIDEVFDPTPEETRWGKRKLARDEYFAF
jgi:hypothetical protein